MEKATHGTILEFGAKSGEKIIKKVTEKMQNSTEKMKKKSEIQLFPSRKNVDDFWLKF